MSRVQVVILGAGIGGSCLARTLAERGVEHVVVDPAPERAASRAALALLRSTWAPGTAQALATYAAWGVPSRSGATVTSYRTPGAEKWQRDWHLVDPSAPLVESRRELGNVTGSVTVDCTGTRTFTVGKTYGVTWVAEPDALADTELRVHHLAPYKVLAAGVTGGTARLGSSSARDLAGARRQADAMLDKAVELGWTPSRTAWRAVEGVRSHAEDRPYAERTAIREWRFGGFHRIGYAVAPIEAVRLADELRAAL